MKTICDLSITSMLVLVIGLVMATAVNNQCGAHIGCLNKR